MREGLSHGSYRPTLKAEKKCTNSFKEISKLTQEEIYRLDSLQILKKIEFIIKKLSNKENSKSRWFPW